MPKLTKDIPNFGNSGDEVFEVVADCTISDTDILVENKNKKKVIISKSFVIFTEDEVVIKNLNNIEGDTTGGLQEEEEKEEKLTNHTKTDRDKIIQDFISLGLGMPSEEEIKAKLNELTINKLLED